jgi:diguanylate cyclase (GGDEF)-like protein
MATSVTDRARVHRGLGRDLAVAVSLATAVLLPTALLTALPGPVLLAVGAVVVLLAVVGVSARHGWRLARRLQEVEGNQAALAHRATHDALTGLANRTLLFERLHLDLRRLGRTGGFVLVAYLDVDELKVVNDSFGHAAGDRLVRAAAQRLTRAVRDVDTVARIGGDEFVVTCAVEDVAAAELLIERLGEAAAPSLHPGGDVGLSLGWVLSADPDDDPVALVARADEAMYRTKAERRGQRGSVWWPTTLTRDARGALDAACGCPAGYGSHLMSCEVGGCADHEPASVDLAPLATAGSGPSVGRIGVVLDVAADLG